MAGDDEIIREAEALLRREALRRAEVVVDIFTGLGGFGGGLMVTNARTRMTGNHMTVNNATIGNTTVTLNEVVAIGHAEEIRARTQAEEERYKDLQFLASQRYLNPAETAEWHTLDRLLPCIEGVSAAYKRRVRVTVDKDAGHWRVIIQVGGTSLSPPSVRDLKPYLDEAWSKHMPSVRRNYIRADSYISTGLNSGLNPQSLSDSLLAWAIARSSTPGRGEATSMEEGDREILANMPATLEAGGRVYRLVPVAEVDVRPLVKRVREKALAGAKVEAGRVRAVAVEDSKALIQQAETKLREAQAESARLLSADKGRCPQWLGETGKWVCFEAGNWWVKIGIDSLITDIRWLVEWVDEGGRGSFHSKVLHWNPIPLAGLPSPFEVKVKIRTEGNYDMNDVKAAGPFSSPHIDRFACMTVQGIPASLKSGGDLATLRRALGRGMSVINLNSLLGGVDNWAPDILKQVPDGVIRLSRGEDRIEPMGSWEAWKAANPRLVTWDREESLEEDGAGVFRVGEG